MMAKEKGRSLDKEIEDLVIDTMDRVKKGPFPDMDDRLEVLKVAIAWRKVKVAKEEPDEGKDFFGEEEKRSEKQTNIERIYEEDALDE